MIVANPGMDMSMVILQAVMTCPLHDQCTTKILVGTVSNSKIDADFVSLFD